MNQTCGIRCPDCGSDGGSRLHSVIDWYDDADGFMVGMRLHCMSCEASWDSWHDVGRGAVS